MYGIFGDSVGTVATQKGRQRCLENCLGLVKGFTIPFRLPLSDFESIFWVGDHCGVLRKFFHFSVFYVCRADHPGQIGNKILKFSRHRCKDILTQNTDLDPTDGCLKSETNYFSRPQQILRPFSRSIFDDTVSHEICMEFLVIRRAQWLHKKVVKCV